MATQKAESIIWAEQCKLIRMTWCTCVPGEKRVIELPEHSVAQGRAQGGGSKVTDVSPVEALFRERDADHHLYIVYV